jgi:excisionase family DNA binding protein
MITDLKFVERRVPAAPQLALADRIERFGRAMTATQLATILAVSRIIIYKLAKRGRIPSFRVGTCVRFDPKAVANWLRTQ